MALIRPLRNSLSYPGNRLPGYDPSHVANYSKGVGLSAIASPGGGGAMIDVLHGSVPSQGTGQTSVMTAGLGPTVNIPHGQYAYNMFPGYNHQPSGGVTFAAIFMVNASVGTANRIININGQNNDNNTCDMGFNVGLNIGIGIGTSSVFSGITLPQLVPLFVCCSCKNIGGSTQINSVMVNLNTGQITPDTSFGGNFNPNSTVSAFFNVGADSSFASASSSKIAAAMYASNTFLSPSQLMQWAQSPWDFWYPQTAASVMAAGVGLASSGTAATGQADGSSDVEGSGYSITGGHATGEADGSSSVSGIGVAVFKGAGEADGSASASGGGASASGAGEADGKATVSGAGATIKKASGAADGSSSVGGAGVSAYVGKGEADGQASVSGAGSGSSSGEADGQASASGGGASLAGGAGEADGQASVHGASTTAGPFFFAWSDPSEKAFGPQHYRTDESVLKFKRAWQEGQCATLEIEIPNPFTGLLSSGRQQWAWFSYRKLDASVVPLFFGRLVSIPSDMEGETVTLHFTAQPLDMLNQKRSVASTLMVRPFYDPVWVREERRLDPDEVLEGYSSAWHVDPTTLVVSTSDYISGEDGTVTLSTGDVLYDSFKTSVGRPPLKSVYVNATVDWVQYAIGTIDMGNKVFSSACGAGLEGSWPKAGSQIGSGWTVAHSQAINNNGPGFSSSQTWSFENKEKTHNFGDVMSWNSSLSMSGPSGFSDPILGGIGASPLLSVIVDEKADGQEGIEDIGQAAWGNYSISKQNFYAWDVKCMLALRYEAKRSRKENVRFILGADLQPVFTDPGGTAANFAQDSEEIHLEGTVGIEGPYGTFRGEWQPNTQYYLFDLFTTGNGTIGWQVLRDHVSLGSFDSIGTAGAWQPNTWFDAGTNFYDADSVNISSLIYSGGYYNSLGQLTFNTTPATGYYQVLISGNTGSSFGATVFVPDEFLGQFRYAPIADPHSGPRLYVNVPNFRGNWVGGGEILVEGDMVYAPDGNMYRVALGHRTAASFDRFASDPTTGQLWYSLMLNPAPVGNISRRSYFPQDRGLWSVENLICRARAHIAQRARPFEVSFDCQFEKAIGITLRNNVNVTDHRLRVSGGSATGKVVETVLTGDGDRGVLIGNVRIACAVGNGGSASSATGTPEYSTNYSAGYQAYTGGTAVLSSSDVGYTAPIDGVVDDGLIFPLTKDDAVVGESFITFSSAPMGSILPPSTSVSFTDGVLTIASRAQQQIMEFQRAISNTQSAYTLTLLPVQNGPFSAEYDIKVTTLSIPQQVNLAIT